MAHLLELRRRLFYIALSIGSFTGLAYLVQAQLTALLLKPSDGQQFIYTTPGGGLDFQLRLCLYGGLAASIPVIIFHVVRYIHPLLDHGLKRFLRRAVLASGCLASLGVMLGYVFGLPPSLHFLLQNFSSERIQALITIQSYMSFVLLYLLACALIFQLPLILILINRIKPLKPRTLMREQRWVIAGAVVAGAVISPTPDMRNLAMISGPIIIMYELSILIIWRLNRLSPQTKKIADLVRRDAEVQAVRLSHLNKPRAAHQARRRTDELATEQAPPPHIVTARPRGRPIDIAYKSPLNA